MSCHHHHLIDTALSELSAVLCESRYLKLYCTSSACVGRESCMSPAVRDVEVFELRHRLIPSVTGQTFVVEEYLLCIQTDCDCDCFYEIDLTRDFVTGDIEEIRVYPIPLPPPRHSRRGIHWNWVN